MTTTPAPNPAPNPAQDPAPTGAPTDRAGATGRPALCTVCSAVGLLGPGPAGRPDAACTSCGSLERHRTLVFLLAGLTGALAHGCLVDVAPSPLVAGRLRGLAGATGAAYLGLDFDPAADRREVDVQASMTDLPLSDRSVGVIVCFHVLEHVPDDLAAMREVARTLAPGGLALVQVPRRTGVPTDEDPSLPEAERVVRFGQADHVRYYGDDFESRLERSGLSFTRLTTGELLGARAVETFGLMVGEQWWFCSTGTPPTAAELSATFEETAQRAVDDGLHEAARELDALRAAVAGLRRSLRRERRAREAAEAREQQVRARPDVRAVSALARQLRRARRLGRRA